MTWDWAFAWEIFPTLLQGLAVTVRATFAASATALIVGLVLEAARRCRWRSAARASGGLIEFIRSTPPLVQLYFIFYVLPNYGLTLSAFFAGVVGLGLHYGTYIAEVYRAGIDSIDRGQWEAAQALNIPTRRTWLAIIMPQAVKAVLPALGNYVNIMFKATPLLATITLTELLRQAQIVGSQTFRYLEPIALVGVLFLLVSYPSAVLLNRMEKRVALR